MDRFRTSQIYIRYETRRLLRAIAKARGKDETIDEVGDELLRKYILLSCPKLVPLLSEMDAVEEKMVDALAKPFDGTEGYM